MISLASPAPWVPRPSRTLKGGSRDCVHHAGSSRCRHSKRNLRPAFIHSHGSGFVQEIETIAAPVRRVAQVNRTTLAGAPSKLCLGGDSLSPSTFTAPRTLPHPEGLEIHRHDTRPVTSDLAIHRQGSRRWSRRRRYTHPQRKRPQVLCCQDFDL